MTRATITKTWVRRIGGAAGWLCFVLLGSVSIFLFTATGDPVPRAFCSWKELGCRPGREPEEMEELPRFGGLSQCGRFFATFNRPESGTDLAIDVVLRNRSDLSLLCEIKAVPPLPLGASASVSEDEKLVALTDHPIRHAIGGRLIRSGRQVDFPTLPELNRVEFLANSQSFAYVSGTSAGLVDLLHPSKNRELHLEGLRDPQVAFFDADADPYALILKSAGRRNSPRVLELWSIATGQRIWQIEGIAEYLKPVAASPFVLAVRMADNDGFVTLISIPDGKRLRDIHVARPEKYFPFPHILPSHSKDGRFFLYPTRRQSLISTWLPFQSSSWLLKKAIALERTFRASRDAISWTLVDLHSDKPGTELFSTTAETFYQELLQRASFHENGNGLTTINDDGLYEWDLPPRMRWFTPWAWVALATWLAMAWLLMRGRLRRSQLRPALSPSH